MPVLLYLRRQPIAASTTRGAANNARLAGSGTGSMAVTWISPGAALSGGLLSSDSSVNTSKKLLIANSPPLGTIDVVPSDDGGDVASVTVSVSPRTEPLSDRARSSSVQ